MMPRVNACLWTTEVGSHMWGDQHPGSDHDLFTCYVIPTEEMLAGRNMGSGSHEHADPVAKIDTKSYEIGKVISLLRLGNVNMIWGVISPIITQSSPDHQRLIDLVLANRGTETLASVRGLAHSAIKQTGKNNRKMFRTAMRTLNFGINWVSGKLNPIRHWELPETLTPQQIEHDYAEMLERLLEAEKTSTYPRLPDVEVFHDFLLRLRVQMLDRQVLNPIDIPLV